MGRGSSPAGRELAIVPTRSMDVGTSSETPPVLVSLGRAVSRPTGGSRSGPLGRWIARAVRFVRRLGRRVRERLAGES